MKQRPVQLLRSLASFRPLQITAVIIGALIVLQLIILGINQLNGSKPVLGLRLEGHTVGKLSGELGAQTEAIIQRYENQGLTIQAADQTSVVSLRQLGVRVNDAQVQAELLAAGRSGNIFEQLVNQDLALVGSRNVTLGHPGFDNKAAKKYLTTFGKKVNATPADAYFAFEDNQVVIHPDKNGRAIDVDAAVELLRRANPQDNKPIVLPVDPKPAKVTAPLLEPILSQAKAIAQKPLTIRAGESQSTLTPKQLVELITPKVAPDPNDKSSTKASISFDEAKLNATLDGVIKKAVVAPEPIVMLGSAVLQQGKSGIQTADEHPLTHVLAALIKRQTSASTPEEVHIPLVAVDPPVVQQAPSRPAHTSTRTGTGLVRLTFDDGPGAYTEQVLNILSSYNVHATFYVVGRNVQSHPGTMQRIKNEGHAIGNHSFSHTNLTYLSREGVRQELASTQAAIQQACGVTPTAFRPPYGAYNGIVSEVAASMGMSVDMWSVDPRDWASPGSGVITQRVLAGTGPGAVVLLHTLNAQTVQALPAIIEGIRAQGFTLE